MDGDSTSTESDLSDDAHAPDLKRARRGRVPGQELSRTSSARSTFF